VGNAKPRPKRRYGIIQRIEAQGMAFPVIAQVEIKSGAVLEVHPL